MLFSGLLACLKGEDGTRIFDLLTERSQLGCGRQALRLFDEDYLFEGAKRRQRAIGTLVNLKLVGGVDNLENFILKVKRLRSELHGTPDQPSNGYVVSLIKTQTKHLPKLQALFAQWDMTATEDQDADALITVLASLCTEMREEKASQGTGKAAVVVEGIVCSNCQKKGHTKKDCWAPGGGSAGKGGKGGKGKPAAKGAREGSAGKGAPVPMVYPPCTFCGKTNHPVEKCFRDPSEPAYRPPKPAAAATMPTTPVQKVQHMKAFGQSCHLHSRTWTLQQLRSESDVTYRQRFSGNDVARISSSVDWPGNNHSCSWTRLRLDWQNSRIWSYQSHAGIAHGHSTRIDVQTPHALVARHRRRGNVL